MQITSVFNRLSDFVKPNRQESAEPSAAQPSRATTTAPPLSRDTVNAMRNVLAQYDVREITPRTFAEMLQKLKQAGVLSESDFKDLSVIRLELEKDGVGADDKVDLLDFCARKMKDFQKELQQLKEKTGATPPADTADSALRRRLEWMQKFAAVHENPMAVGLEAEA